MENNLLLFTILGLTLIGTFSQIIFLILKGPKKHSQTFEDVGVENYDPLSLKIIHDAQEKANKILANAELKGIEFLSKQKLDINEFQEVYVKSIKNLETGLVNQFQSSIDRADQSYQGFLQVIQENMRQQELANQRIFQEKISALVESAQTTMTGFITETNSKVGKQIDDELKVVRIELDMYKKHRMEVINKYIIDILERTLEETLGKKLTLQEHSELIFQALERAKSEQKFIEPENQPASPTGGKI